MVAKTQQGLEHLLAKELEDLGAEDVRIHKRAVSYKGDRRLLYRSNLELRTALRILVPILRFKVRNEHELYQKIQQIDWSRFLHVQGTLAIESIVHSDFFNHSKYVALKTKDAIVDQFRNKTGKRPSVDIEYPDLRINIHITQDQCTLSFDSSNDSLHKRGYRTEANEAPLNEVTAAAMILQTNWDRLSPITDPMCGSGTILAEAGMIAANIPPNMQRKDFGFLRWSDFDETLWNDIRKTARTNIKATGMILYGSDISSENVLLTRENLSRAGLADMARVKKCDFFELQPSAEQMGTVMMNPPYGMRLKPDDIGAFYKSIGDKLKKDFVGYTAWILTANPDAMKRVGLATSMRIPVWNGQLESRWNRYDLYLGSKKKKED